MIAKTFKLAVLFADLSGGQSRQRADVVDLSVKILKTLSRSYRGRVISIDAAQVMACFPDTDDACMAAVDIQRKLASEAGQAARIALHSGLCLVEGSTIFGDVVDETEALLALTRDSEIVLSESLMHDALESATDGARPAEAAGQTLYRLPWQQQDSALSGAAMELSPQAREVLGEQLDRQVQDPREARQAEIVKEAEIARKTEKAGKARKVEKARKVKKAEKAKKAKEEREEREEREAPQEVNVASGEGRSPAAAAEIAGDEVAIEPLHASLVDDPVLALYGLDNDIDIASNSGVFCIGRDAEMNDWTFAKPIVSRCHLQIEFLDGHFVLQDCSTNGTYVTIDGQPEQHLKRSELILRGTGLISLSLAAYKDPELMIRFELREDNELYS